MKYIFWSVVIAAVAGTSFANVLIAMIQEWAKNLVVR
jgi:hypothetical protein